MYHSHVSSTSSAYLLSERIAFALVRDSPRRWLLTVVVLCFTLPRSGGIPSAVCPKEFWLPFSMLQFIIQKREYYAPAG